MAPKRTLAEQVVYGVTAMELLWQRVIGATPEEFNILTRDFYRLSTQTISLAEGRIDRTAYERYRQEAKDWVGVFDIPEPRQSA